jgi:dienelactone hydrolase
VNEFQSRAVAWRAKWVLAAVLGLCAALAAAPRAWSDDLVEDSSFFRVNIGGHSVRLEGLVVKRANAVGRLPIALITHGKAADMGGMLDDHAVSFVGQAHDLARRGWLAVVVIRRGFGNSDGSPLPSISCANTTSFAPQFDSAADDLQATLDVIVQRPDADPSRIIAMGVSAGGAAVVALGARNPKGLVGIINVSGGLRTQSCPKEDVLVSTFKQYGAKSRVPSLWLYAKNDSFFGPELVERMHNAFLDGGADVKLVTFDPIGSDGHFLFGLGVGRAQWLMQMDGFLRAHNLPTWTRADVDALMKKVSAVERSRSFLEGYIAAPSERALARAPVSNRMYDGYGSKTIELARTNALNRCQAGSGEPSCIVLMENDVAVGIKP